MDEKTHTMVREEADHAVGMRRTVEDLAKAKDTPPWLFAALKALRGWAVGQEVTEAQYDAAAHEAAHVEIGYRNRHER